MNEVEVACPIKASDLKRIAPEGITIEDRGEILAKTIDSDTLYVIGISWVASIPANLVSAFLYDAIKKRSGKNPKSIIINDTPLEFRHDLIANNILRFTGGSK